MEICDSLFGRTNHSWCTSGIFGIVSRSPTLQYFQLKPKQPSKSHETASTEKHNLEEETLPPRYYCKICDNPVGFVGDENNIGNTPTVSAHMNPFGFVHEIFTIRFVQNCLFYGTPNSAESWFPGFLWVHCICQICHSHLGWAYFKPDQDLYQFVGLRREAVKQ